MTRRAGVVCARVGVVAAIVLLLEALCRLGVVKPLTMIPPSEMVVEMIDQLEDAEVRADIAQTVGEVLAAFAVSVLAGFALGAVVQGRARVRQALAPVLASWYA